MRINPLIRKIIVGLLIVSVLVVGGKYVYDKILSEQAATVSFNSRPTPKFKNQTSISPAFYSDDAFIKHLKDDYPFVYEAAYETPQNDEFGKNYVIPGLLQTRAYNFSKKKYGKSTYMTPQGLTIAGNYVVISAYDGAHLHASVLYVIDKKTGKYIKTIHLNGRPHVGGLAYDPVEKNLWITGSRDEAAVLAAIKLDKIKSYKDDKNSKPIEYDQYITLPTIQRASTVTYFDNQLFVGFFDAYEEGTIAAYTIAREGPAKGSITNDEISSITGQLSMSDSSGQSKITSQIQGIAVTADRIFLTQSYGGNDAKLYVYPISAIRNLSEENAERIIPMPPYMEQIYVSGDQMLALFESGSKSYARDTITIMDRVLAMNVNALLN